VSDLIERDQACLWHPYTQHGLEPDPLPIARARGATLELADGRTVIDAISSWWATLHGHGHPVLVEAMARQAAQLDHVLFAGTTHAPAVELAEALLQIAPPGLARVFFSDNGSTAVEVALKMAYQRWVLAGEQQRTVFLALEGGYHGDTFGAMAVSDPDPFFQAFEPLLFEVRRVAPRAEALAAALLEVGDHLCAVILEPLVQGAAGMKMHGPEFLRAAREGCDRAGVPLIADEVMTGFGRTGTLFACEQADITPDLLCLSKGLTGGTMPLAATLTTAQIYEAFRSTDRARAFFHGHTYTAHPIACAVARASLELTLADDVPHRLDTLGERIEDALGDLRDHERVLELRRCGGIVALELDPPPGGAAGYLADMAPRLRKAAIERGVLLRPLGNVLYAMPPACTSEEESVKIAQAMRELVELA
jgi:adenosylmethionine-8-amino-7-oxononanoate aminotransferase